MDRDDTQADVPDDIANAEPAGGWEAGSSGGAATEQGDGIVSNEDKERADDADRGRSGEPATLAPDGTPDGASDQFVEGAEIQQGLDPDVLTDQQADQR